MKCVPKCRVVFCFVLFYGTVTQSLEIYSTDGEVIAIFIFDERRAGSCRLFCLVLTHILLFSISYLNI